MKGKEVIFGREKAVASSFSVPKQSLVVEPAETHARPTNRWANMKELNG